MRIAHVGNFKTDSANGVDRTVHGLAVNTARLGVDVEVWHLSRKSTVIGKRIESGVTVYDLPRPGDLRALVSGLGPEIEAFINNRSSEVDLVHFHSVFVPENVLLSRFGFPFVVTPNGGYRAGSRRRAWLKAIWLTLFERPYLNSAAAIHTVFRSEVEDIVRVGCRRPCALVPNAVPDEFWLRQVSPAARGDIILFVGRLAIDHKGLDLLVNGYAKALARVDLPDLILAGPDFRSGTDWLLRECRRLRIADRVQFPGLVSGEAKMELFESACLFAHPSRWEGLPFALIEALAMERPVLVTPGTNVAEYVAEAGAGWVCEPSSDAVADSLVEFAGCGEELQVRAIAARGLARSRFAWESAAEEMREVYDSILDGRIGGHK